MKQWKSFLHNLYVRTTKRKQTFTPISVNDNQKLTGNDEHEPICVNVKVGK